MNRLSLRTTFAVATAAVLVACGNAGSGSDNSAAAPKKEQGTSPVAASPVAPAPVLPAIAVLAGQQAFIEAVRVSQQEAKSVDNDMQLGGVKGKRDRAICQVVAPKFWVGTIKTLDSNSDGKGVLEVEIAPGIVVGTWNNALSDIMDETLLAPGTPVFENAARLKRGSQVVFTGAFRPDPDPNAGCIRDRGMTLRGKVQEPSFIFRFHALFSYEEAQKEVAKVQAEEAAAARTTEAAAAAASASQAAQAPAAAGPAGNLQEPAPVAKADPAAKPETGAVASASAAKESVPAPQPATVAAAPVSSEGPPTSLPSQSVQPVVFAPSFDCAKASNGAERLICSDRDLARVDVELNQAYLKARAATTDKKQLQAEQVEWMKHSRNACSDKECMLKAYGERKAALAG